MSTPKTLVERLQQLISLLLALSITLSAYALLQTPGETGILRTLILFALGFSLALGLWLRLQSIVEAGMCGDRFAAASMMLLAFGFALMPFLLPGLYAGSDASAAATARLLPLAFAIMMWLMAAIVQRWLSQPENRSSTDTVDWQHVRNALVAAAALFLISIALPRQPTAILGLSAQSLLWIIAIIAQPLYLMLVQRPLMKAPVLVAGQTLAGQAGGLAVTAATPTPQTQPLPVEQPHGRRPAGRGRRHRHMGSPRRRL